MDYGSRQARAEFLVRVFRAQGAASFDAGTAFTSMTGAEIADHIENMTDQGKTLVAIAGFVLRALRTPRHVLAAQLLDPDPLDDALFTKVITNGATALELDASAIARQFRMSRDTAERWLKGTSRPHPAVRPLIFQWLSEKLAEGE